METKQIAAEIKKEQAAHERAKHAVVTTAGEAAARVVQSTMMALNFSTNWNNKLDCKAFTTLRLHDPDRFLPGKPAWVRSKEKDYGTYRIAAVKTLLLRDINEFIARVDTGYSKDECVKIIQTMYKSSGLDWNTQKLDLVLLYKIAEEEEQPT